MSNDSLTMTIPEVARVLRISRGLAYELAKQNKLPVTVLRLGEKRMVVPRRELEALLSGTVSNKDLKNGTSI
jgi:excisionase family DNA binding protein